MLSVTFLSSGIELTPSIQSYTEEKLNMLEKFFDPNKEVMFHVEIGKSSNHHNSGPFQRCEITCTTPDFTLRTDKTDADLYAAIDLAKDDLKSQLIKSKEKSKDKHRAPRPGKE